MKLSKEQELYLTQNSSKLTIKEISSYLRNNNLTQIRNHLHYKKLPYKYENGKQIKLNKEQLDKVVECNGEYNCKELKNIINFDNSASALRRQLKRRNLPYNKLESRKFTDYELDWLKENGHKYYADEIIEVLPELKAYGNRNLRERLKYHNIELKKMDMVRASTFKKERYDYDRNMFSKPIDKEVAFIWGLFLSDGHQSGKDVTWVMKDKDILEVIRRLFRGNVPIKEVYVNDSICNGHIVNANNPYYRLSFSSIELCQQIETYGYGTRKTYDCKFPDFIPERYISYFLAGYHFGDGHIGISQKNKIRCEFTGHRDLLEGISKYTNSNAKVLSIKNNFASVYRLYGNPALQLLHFMYNDLVDNDGEPMYLKRKYDIYTNYCNSIN